MCFSWEKSVYRRPSQRAVVESSRLVIQNRVNYVGKEVQSNSTCCQSNRSIPFVWMLHLLIMLPLTTEVCFEATVGGIKASTLILCFLFNHKGTNTFGQPTCLGRAFYFFSFCVCNCDRGLTIFLVTEKHTNIFFAVSFRTGPSSTFLILPTYSKLKVWKQDRIHVKNYASCWF